MALEPATDRMRDLLDTGLQALDLDLKEHTRYQLINYVLLLQKWNRVYNLTAVRQTEEMIGRHLLDSLSVLPWVSGRPKRSAHVADKYPDYDVLDVGSGAGLPVFPLAIAKPELSFLSVESNGKKTRFQQQVIQELGIDNVHIETSRIERVNSTAQTVISRAFTSPVEFLSTVNRHCLLGSRVIVMLGQREKWPSELPEGFTLTELHAVDVPHVKSQRHVAVCLFN